MLSHVVFTCRYYGGNLKPTNQFIFAALYTYRNKHACVEASVYKDRLSSQVYINTANKDGGHLN